MSIVGLSLFVNRLGVNQIQGFNLQAAVVPIGANERPAVTTTQREETFTLQNTISVIAPEYGAIPYLIIENRVFFEDPSFTLSGQATSLSRTLTWHDTQILSVAGKTVIFRSFGGDLTLGHYAVERINAPAGTTRYTLKGQPAGRSAILFINGEAFPQSGGLFDIELNELVWKNPVQPLSGSRVYLFYPRSLEAAAITYLQSYPLSVASSGLTSNRVVELAATPANANSVIAMIGGRVYVEGRGITLNGRVLTIDPTVEIQNGDTLSVWQTIGAVLTPIVQTGGTTGGSTGGGSTGGGSTGGGSTGGGSLSVLSPNDMFKHFAATGSNLSFSYEYRDNVFAIVNGLAYMLIKAKDLTNPFSISGTTVTWPGIKPTDQIRFIVPAALGYNPDVVADWFRWGEASFDTTVGASREQTITLEQDSYAIEKTVLVVGKANADNVLDGGLIHFFGGDAIKRAGNDNKRQLLWNVDKTGYALKSGDVVRTLTPASSDTAAKIKFYGWTYRSSRELMGVDQIQFIHLVTVNNVAITDSTLYFRQEQDRRVLEINPAVNLKDGDRIEIFYT